jgi:hypothetical protein
MNQALNATVIRREKSVTEQVLDPRRNDIGNLGAAMVAAAEKKEGK